MAFSTILHKRNSIQTVVPNPSSLELGEIALNTADGVIFTKTEENDVVSFLNANKQPFNLNTELSSVTTQFGSNSVTGVLAAVLGGYDNSVDGSGSTALNGENIQIDGDFATVANGLNIAITPEGDYSFNASGQNNLIRHQNVYTLGSNLTSHSNDFTYVNNLSSKGKIYGDGSELTGIVAGDSGATTFFRANSANYQSTYTTVQTNSASWSNPSGGGSDVSQLSGNWQNTYTFVNANSGLWIAPALKKFDYIEGSPSVSYSGVANYGTATNSNSWKITKIVYTTSGSAQSITEANSVAWDNRLSVNYT